MPAPVEFTIRVGALPPGFKGDPQALATAIAERLIITPSEPWSSFINGGAQPSSNVGPFLAGGVQWKVWSDALGEYTFQQIDGQGLVAASVKRDAMQDGTPGTVFIYGADGRPQMISGLPNQQIIVGNDLIPAFGYAATGSYFTVRLSAPQAYVADGTVTQLKFDSVSWAQGITPDTTNFRIPVPANSIWLFGVSLQIDRINGATADPFHSVNIRKYQLDAASQGSFVETAGTAPPQQGVQATSLVTIEGAGYVDVAVASQCTTAGNDFEISNNGINTRFWGFRLV